MLNKVYYYYYYYYTGCFKTPAKTLQNMVKYAILINKSLKKVFVCLQKNVCMFIHIILRWAYGRN
jgi:hypothetical protein